MIKIKKCLIEKVTTRLSNKGDVLVKVMVGYNLTRTGDLTGIANLVALQDQNVGVTIEPEQQELDFTGADAQ